MEGEPGGEGGWADRGQRVPGETDCVERGPRSKMGQVGRPSAVWRPRTLNCTDTTSRLSPLQGSKSRTILARGSPQPRALHPQNLVPGEKAARV